MRSAKKYQWPIWISAETHHPDGRRVTINRKVEGAGDAVGAMKRTIMARKDKGRPFHGCEIVGITLLGQKIIRILDPDKRELVSIDRNYH